MTRKPNSSLNLRCTPAEHKAISAKAQELGLSLSEYIRFTALNSVVSVQAGKAAGLLPFTAPARS